MNDDLTVISPGSSSDNSTKYPGKNDRTVFVKHDAKSQSESEQSDKTRISHHSGHNFAATRIIKPHLDVLKIEESVESNNNLTITTGSVLKKRFVLNTVLGVGGMGIVYKAIDLRKQEAGDKHPYIAIKVLNDEFREHPESLIALQREARKSQQLSHPNIVNVHDFDRDGDVVYMTMELLKGKPLDQLIAEDYPQGIPEKQATPIINAVAKALYYAHQHGIVHSDLKPSNIFITDQHQAKIFDFGIARACQLSQDQMDDADQHITQDILQSENVPDATLLAPTLFEPTLFDPTKLGALTPTYASLEMLEGKAPEPHDDIFSMGCVFYELLTGNHPYKRLSADKASEQSLQAKKIPALEKSESKEKAKAIFKTLEFDGKNRFENLELFIEAYNYKKKSKRAVLLSSFILIIFLLMVFFPQFKEQYHFSQQTQFISFVNSLDSELHQDDISKIQHHLNTLDNKTKNYVLENIKDKWLILIQKEIAGLMYGDSNKHQYDDVFALLKITQSYYSDSAQVARLFELFEKQRFIEINRLNNQFNELLETLQFSLSINNSIEHEKILQIITSIKRIEATHPLVTDQRLLLIYQENIERLSAEYKMAEANDLLEKAQVIYPNEIVLLNLADKLKHIKLNIKNKMPVYEDPDFNTQDIDISMLKQKLLIMISQPDISDDWDNEVSLIYQQLLKTLGHRSIWLNEKKQTLASLYLQKSVSMRDDQRLVEARRFLEKAKQYNPAIFGLDDDEAILNALENIVRVKHNAKQRLAKIEGLKITLTTQLKAQEMKASIRTYKDLKRILGRNDPFIATEAKHNIAEAYYKQAKQMFSNKDYPKTIEIAGNGLKFAGQHSALRILRNKAEKQQNILKNSLLLAQQSPQKVNLKKQVSLNKEVKNDINLSSEQVNTPSADRCKVQYAGYGKRKRANCYDNINDHFKAPILVVVPPRNSNEGAFAISKYEITIKDYNYFCQQSAECAEKKGNSSLPVTGISIDKAEKYVHWLTKMTRKNYSIPTSGQWLHAAKTQQSIHYNDVNCRIKFGSKLLKGQNMLTANTGQSNPWGIMNIIGNAREFVMDNTVTSARGGAHIDAIKDCTIDNKQSNIAQGDSYTGFRVVREVKVQL